MLKKVFSSFFMIGMLFSLFLAGMTFVLHKKTFADELPQETLVWYHDKGGTNWTPLYDGYEVRYQVATNTAQNIIAVCGETIYRFKKDEREGEITLTNKDGEEVKMISSLGEYTLTISAGEHYGETLVISVVSTRINLANSVNFEWTKTNSGRLGSGTVYTYEYTEQGETKTYYTTSLLTNAPVSGWENWTKKEETKATRSILGMNTASIIYRIESHLYIPNASSSDYEVECTGNTASGMGKYTATAVLKPKNPGYTFYYNVDELSVYSPHTGMTGEVRADGAVVITKVWYVARYENELLDFEKTQAAQDEVVYSVPDWSFGQAPSVTMPYLRAGDEWRVKDVAQLDGYILQKEGGLLLTHNRGRWDWSSNELQDGYTSGKLDFVTFTLVKDGEEICKNQTRAAWEDYINQFTPVGNYTVIFSCVAIQLENHNTWWSESVIISDNLGYGAFVREYSFQVSKGMVEIAQSDIGQNYELNLDAFLASPSYLTELLAEKLKFNELITWEAVKNSNVYWKQAEECYDIAPFFTFRLDGTEGEYLPADADWSGLIPETYRMYYRVNFINYEVVYETDSDAVFTLIVYRELVLPELKQAALTYTGESQKVELKEENDKYVLSDYTGTDAGTYTALCTLVDPVHYKWEGIGGRSAELQFVIERAAVKVPDSVESIYTGSAQRADVPVETDKFGKKIFTAAYPEDKENGFTEAGEYLITLKLLDAKNYRWVDDNGAIEGDAVITFRITERAQKNKAPLIAVICVGCAAGVAGIGALAWFVYRKKRHGND